MKSPGQRKLLLLSTLAVACTLYLFFAPSISARSDSSGRRRTSKSFLSSTGDALRRFRSSSRAINYGNHAMGRTARGARGLALRKLRASLARSTQLSMARMAKSRRRSMRSKARQAQRARRIEKRSNSEATEPKSETCPCAKELTKTHAVQHEATGSIGLDKESSEDFFERTNKKAKYSSDPLGLHGISTTTLSEIEELNSHNEEALKNLHKSTKTKQSITTNSFFSPLGKLEEVDVEDGIKRLGDTTVAGLSTLSKLSGIDVTAGQGDGVTMEKSPQLSHMNLTSSGLDPIKGLFGFQDSSSTESEKPSQKVPTDGEEPEADSSFEPHLSSNEEQTTESSSESHAETSQEANDKPADHEGDPSHMSTETVVSSSQLSLPELEKTPQATSSIQSEISSEEIRPEVTSERLESSTSGSDLPETGESSSTQTITKHSISSGASEDPQTPEKIASETANQSDETGHLVSETPGQESSSTQTSTSSLQLSLPETETSSMGSTSSLVQARAEEPDSQEVHSTSSESRSSASQSMGGPSVEDLTASSSPQAIGPISGNDIVDPTRMILSTSSQAGSEHSEVPRDQEPNQSSVSESRSSASQSIGGPSVEDSSASSSHSLVLPNLKGSPQSEKSDHNSNISHESETQPDSGSSDAHVSESSSSESRSSASQSMGGPSVEDSSASSSHSLVLPNLKGSPQSEKSDHNSNISHESETQPDSGSLDAHVSESSSSESRSSASQSMGGPSVEDIVTSIGTSSGSDGPGHGQSSSSTQVTDESQSDPTVSGNSRSVVNTDIQSSLTQVVGQPGESTSTDSSSQQSSSQNGNESSRSGGDTSASSQTTSTSQSSGTNLENSPGDTDIQVSSSSAQSHSKSTPGQEPASESSSESRSSASQSTGSLPVGDIGALEVSQQLIQSPTATDSGQLSSSSGHGKEVSELIHSPHQEPEHTDSSSSSSSSSSHSSSVKTVKKIRRPTKHEIVQSGDDLYESPKVHALPKKCRNKLRHLRSLIDEILTLVERIGQNNLLDESVSYHSRDTLSRRLAKIRRSAREARMASYLANMSIVNETVRAAGLELIKLSNNKMARKLEPNLRTFALNLRKEYGLYRKMCKGSS